MPVKTAANARETLALLKEGNERFASGQARHPHQMLRSMPELKTAQHPRAMVLGCADSRVPLEITFDVGLGDLFVIRVAGNVGTPGVIASVEFGLAELGIPLLVVIGHTHCGAVTGAYRAIVDNAIPAGHLGDVVNIIRPAIRLEDGDAEACIAAGVRRNVENVVETLRTTPPLVAEAVEKRLFHVIGGCYHIGTGRVEFYHNIPDPV